LWADIANTMAAIQEDSKSGLNKLDELNQKIQQATDRTVLLESWSAALAARKGLNDPETLDVMSRLAQHYDGIFRWDEAVKVMKLVVEKTESNLGIDAPGTIAAKNNLGGFYRRAGKWTEAEILYQQLRDRAAAKLGPNDRVTLDFEYKRVFILECNRGPSEAIPLYKQVFETQTTQFGQDDPDTLQTMFNLAFAYYRTGRHDQADLLSRDLLDRRKIRNGPQSGPVFNALSLLGMNLVAQKKYTDAEQAIRECLFLAEKNKEPEMHRFRIMNMLGLALAGQGKHAAAEKLLLDGYEGLSRFESSIPAPWKWFLVVAASNVAQFYELTGELEKARLWREKVKGTAQPIK
jgi:tetratricopeptide (TPR) repeat protein